MSKKDQPKYVDAFVLVVPKDKVEAYREMAREGGEMWMKHGALAYRECMGDDLNPEMGGGMEGLRFPQMTKADSNETVWFSYIEFESKEHRDLVNKKVMAEMEEKYKDHPDAMQNMPFDMKKMAYGGFTAEVSF